MITFSSYFWDCESSPVTCFPFKFRNSWDVCSHQIFSCYKLQGSIGFWSDSLLVLSSSFGQCPVFPFLSSWVALHLWPPHSPRLGQISGWLRQVLRGPPKIQAVLGPQIVCHSRECVKLCSALAFESLSHRIWHRLQISRKVLFLSFPVSQIGLLGL